MENKEGFSFTYSAEQQKEIEAIRKKYLPKEESKMEQLRRLHAIPTQKAQACAIALGVIGALIMGTGMSLCMTELGAALGGFAMGIGIAVGVAGIAAAALAWPLGRHILDRERRKIAPRILRLTDELM